MTIAIRNASFTYAGSGNGGVRDISLTINEGELLAVIGPSGCGKSTALKLIAGFLLPQTGQILINGQDATAIAPRQRNLGVVFQNYSLFPHMTVAGNIAYPLKLRGMSRTEIGERVGQVLVAVSLSAMAERFPRALSGGQQQRVALARALVFRPQALLLDEPLSALDANLRLEMRDEIIRLQRLYGIATLHITHDQEEAMSMADRVAVMHEGRILQVGPPRDVYDKPANHIVAAFVGQSNLMDAVVLDATRVRTALGDLEVADSVFAPGQAATVVIRPERIQPCDSAVSGNTFFGVITIDRFLGAVRRFDFKTSGGQTLKVETGRSGPCNAIHIPPDAVQVIAAGAPKTYKIADTGAHSV